MPGVRVTEISSGYCLGDEVCRGVCRCVCMCRSVQRVCVCRCVCVCVGVYVYAEGGEGR